MTTTLGGTQTPPLLLPVFAPGRLFPLAKALARIGTVRHVTRLPARVSSAAFWRGALRTAAATRLSAARLSTHRAIELGLVAYVLLSTVVLPLCFRATTVRRLASVAFIAVSALKCFKGSRRR
jgi:hypothetical protein